MYLLATYFLTSIEKYMLPCMSKQVLGFDCPGCGLQRSILLLFSGDIVGAFKMYPAIFTLIPLGIVLLTNRFVNLKYANQMIIGLSVSTVALILINYIIKLIH